MATLYIVVNHYHSPNVEHFHLRESSLVPLLSASFSTQASLLRYISLKISFACCKLHVNGIIRYAFFCVQFLFLSIISDIYPFCCVYQFLSSYSAVCIYHNLILSSVVGYLGWFQLWDIMNKAALNLCI